LAATGEFGDDGIDGGGPDKWFGFFVPSGQKLFDRSDEILDAKERMAADTLGWSIRRTSAQLGSANCSW